jgi:myo-inositol-1-phosphate synthase
VHIHSPTSYLMKSPHNQRPDDEARELTEQFIGEHARSKTPVAGAARKAASAEA